MFPVSSESTRETIVLNSTKRLAVTPQLHRTKNGTVYQWYMNPQSVFALQQIILFISGVYTERFICKTK